MQYIILSQRELSCLPCLLLDYEISDSYGYLKFSDRRVHSVSFSHGLRIQWQMKHVWIILFYLIWFNVLYFSNSRSNVQAIWIYLQYSNTIITQQTFGDKGTHNMKLTMTDISTITFAQVYLNVKCIPHHSFMLGIIASRSCAVWIWI